MRATVRVPATVANLGPGFDVLALALELQNEVEAEQTGEAGISIDPGPGSPEELRDPDRNLVVGGWTAACQAIGVASSAAAALSGVLAAVALHRPPWDEVQILETVTALEGHPDNAAAALLGGLVIVPPGAMPVTMRVPEELLAVVFIPEMELSTRAAREVVPTQLSRADAVFNAARCALFIRAVAEKDWATLGTAMEDRWHQAQRTALMPALPDLIAGAVAAGACGAALSGAGPSVVALSWRDPEAVQRRSIVSRVRNWGARVDTAG